MRQERAARTRRTLVDAAAGVFDRHGYEGTSLTRIAQAADTSLGALTFHFASKESLARTVGEQGLVTTRDAVAALPAHPGASVEWLASLTLALTGLLDREPVVRAAARLTRELLWTPPNWYSVWQPALRARLDTARPDELPPGADPATLTALASHLITGSESCARHRAYHPDASEQECPGTSEDVPRILRLVLDPTPLPETAHPTGLVPRQPRR
ncbi:TetR/AcrR family transcriptional regulator [Streptomyces roseirectus]|uniref:TetR/AcrR family transcriptional regulator n=1 Tax=Streptomyces roseirectus TaxID=2768066 RepID=A0A7H0ICC4_9ACTN|nr:TetR/AcrR family transcriptional regulator [Streptomyces roseirectus]QNP70440.1 TetR/AcrR family transcriptional regulator [Streptomyces roseirectus]